MQLKLKLLEAEVAKAEGEQVAVAEVERAQFERARRMRDEMLLVSQRVGPQLHMIDWRQAARIVDVAIREALGGGPASVEAAPKKKRRGRK